MSYENLNSRRAGIVGNITKIRNSVNSYDPTKDDVRILEKKRLLLNIYRTSHDDIVHEMFSHSNCDIAKLQQSVDDFHTSLIDANFEIEDKIIEFTPEELPKSSIECKRAIETMKMLQLELEEHASFTVGDTESMTVAVLKVHKGVLQPLKDKFNEAWTIISSEVKGEEKEIHLRQKSEFFKIYIECLAWFDQKVFEKKLDLDEAQYNNYEFKTKLAPVEIPRFNGNPADWQQFHDVFKAFMHDNPHYPSVEKFRRPKTHITDKLSPIANHVETNAGYDDAWKSVCKYYDDKRRSIDYHFAEILNTKPILNTNADEMQKLINHFVLQITSLQRNFTNDELFEALMARLAMNCLDVHTRELFETENKNQIPMWPELKTFLEERRKTLSTLPPAKMRKKPMNFNASSTKPFASKKLFQTNVAEIQKKFPKTRRCHFCMGEHSSHWCPEYLTLSIPERNAKVKPVNLCLNCLGDHTKEACKSKFSCQMCQFRHHTTLHKNDPDTKVKTHHVSRNASLKPSSEIPLFKANVVVSSESYLEAPTFNSLTATHKQPRSLILLSTALIRIKDAFSQWHQVRALLDSGSNANFMTQRTCEIFKIKPERICVEIHGIGKNPTIVDRSVTTYISSRVYDLSYKVEFLIIPHITGHTPIGKFEIPWSKLPDEIELADPYFNAPGDIDIIIGNELFLNLMQQGKIELPNGPTFSNSSFGYLVGGKVENLPHIDARTCNLVNVNDIRESIERFYKLEDYRNQTRFLTAEEQYCESLFEQTHQRDKDGRFIVSVPLKDNVNQPVNNYRQAMSQCISNERRLKRDERLKHEYDNFMTEYELLGHMREIDISAEPSNFIAYYLPHHAIEKPDSSTTKVRVVFNASSKTSSGLSLNDVQCVGPKIQSDSFDLMLRFRKPTIVVKGDLAKMYRQFLLTMDHRRLHRIIWNGKVFELNTITYGAASSSFLATRCLKQLAIEYRDKYPQAAKEVEEGFYVDDILTGEESIESTKILFDQINEIVSSGYLKLRKISSNSKEFLLIIPESDLEPIAENQAIKALGVQRSPNDDTIGFNIKPINLENVTKRAIFSEIAKIYDPEGLLGPVVFRLKLFIKMIWNSKVNWDEAIPNHIAEQWHEVAGTINQLNSIKIDRCVKIKSAAIFELHGFSDGSSLGYGACVYLVSEDMEGERKCSLLCAKSRIAPNEYISTARIELCGCVILVNLMERVKNALHLEFNKIICWFDSSIMGHWIKKPPASFQQFVANRVNEIQTKGESIQRM